MTVNAASPRTGPLLMADTLDRYTPVGAFGQPVYLSHVQLKAAVRQKLGPRAAAFFARPEQDPQSRTIRWVADTAGEAVPWGDLPAERQVALALTIEEMRSGFRAYAAELRSQAGAPQAAAFASLLEGALQVPAADHVFVVGDQPVLSFWGFRDGDRSPFDPLSVEPGMVRAKAPPPIPPDPPAPPPAAVVAAVRRRAPWALWSWLLAFLLALLLLALLFFLLRGFPPAVDPDLPRPPDLPPPAATAPPTVPAPAQQVPAPQAPPNVPPAVVPPGPTPVRPEEPPAAPPQGVLPVLPDGSAVPVVPVLPGGDGTLPVLPLTPDGRVDGLLVPKPDGAVTAPKPDAAPPKPESAVTPPKPEAVAPKPDAVPPKPDGAQTKPDQPPVNPGAIPPRPEAKPQVPQPLTIPPVPPPGGGLDYMAGDWRSQQGLVDSQTKQPLEQRYRFDREGKGEVIILRPDGTQCRAPARVVQGPNGLTVEEQGDPRCPDGRTYGRARTECRREADGRTGCYGVNADGSTYRVDIERGGAP